MRTSKPDKIWEIQSRFGKGGWCYFCIRHPRADVISEERNADVCIAGTAAGQCLSAECSSRTKGRKGRRKRKGKRKIGKAGKGRAPRYSPQPGHCSHMPRPAPKRPIQDILLKKTQRGRQASVRSRVRACPFTPSLPGHANQKQLGKGVKAVTLN